MATITALQFQQGFTEKCPHRYSFTNDNYKFITVGKKTVYHIFYISLCIPYLLNAVNARSSWPKRDINNRHNFNGPRSVSRACQSGSVSISTIQIHFSGKFQYSVQYIESFMTTMTMIRTIEHCVLALKFLIFQHV
jgi:hypothetical protein